MKSIDPEFSALVKRVIEQNAEVLKRLAEFDAEEETDVVEGAPVVEEIVIEEVKAEDVAAAIDATIAENADRRQEMKYYCDRIMLRYRINRSWGDGIIEALWWAWRGKSFPDMLSMREVTQESKHGTETPERESK